MAQTGVILKKFKNGLRVVLYPMPNMESVSIGIWVRMGGRFENQRYKGISHFLEHMVFKGSRHYSGRKIKELLEGVGGSLNAFTSEEHTCYLVKLPARHINRGLDVLSDMVLWPTLDEDEFNREKLVIFEEIRMYMDIPQYYVVELAQELIWKDHPLGRPLAGTMESVGRITRNVMAEFQRGFYRPNNMVVSIAGKVDERVLDKIEEIFDIGEKGRSPRDIVFSKVQDRPRLNVYEKQTEQSHLCLAIPAYSYLNPKRYALGILNVIIGGNMSSRLFNEVREKRGLAYHISSSVAKMKDTGALVIKAGTEHKSLKKTLEVIYRELEKIALGRISVGEFKRGKEFLIGQITLNLEDTMENMLMLGGRLLNAGEVEMPDEIRDKLEAVELDDVKRVAKDILQPKRYNLAVISPAGKGLERFGDISGG